MAEQNLNTSLFYYEMNVNSLFAYAELMISQGQTQKANFFIQKATSIKDIEYYDFFIKGPVLKIPGDYEGSLKCTSPFVWIKKELFEEYYKISNLYIETSQFDSSISCLDNILNFDKNNKKALQLKADVNLRNKDIKKATEIYQQILEIYPEDEDTLFKIATMYSLINKTELEEQYYLKILKTNPNNKETLLRLGIMYNDRKDYAKS